MDLAVERDPRPAVRQPQRLIAGFAQIQDPQSAISQSNLPCDVGSVAVRPAMGDDRGHLRKGAGFDRLAVALPDAGYTAHAGLLRVPADAIWSEVIQ